VARLRGLEAVHWWVGWSPPAGIVDELVAQGLEIDADEPVFAGLTCAREPPAAPHVDVRPLRTVADYLEALAADDQVWGVSPEERERTRAFEVERFEQDERSGVVHHWAAYDDGRPVGFARAVDMADGVALMGGSVLPSHRGRGVYRALVHARWRHAAGRGTPLLVVQAGRMSAPVLAGLGFVRHGSLLALVDRL
jgi:GNAT superfamily N-acetyltransferase